MEISSNTPERREQVAASNEQKLALLAQVYRIASFDGGEPSFDDDPDLRIGYHGHAFGPNGEATCSTLDAFDLDGESLFRDRERVEVAVLRLGDHSYHILAVLDKDAFEAYRYEYQPLSEAIYCLANPLQDFSPSPHATFDPEDYIGFMPTYTTQHLEIYRDIPSAKTIEQGGGDPEYDAYISRLRQAIDTYDADEVKRLLERDKPSFLENEIPVDQLRDIEITAMDEVDEVEIQRLATVLFQEYFAVTNSSST